MPPGVLEENRVHAMDALEGLKALADESVDLIVTDPPYNIAAKDKYTIRHSKLMSTMEAWGTWDAIHPFDYEVMMLAVISQCYRVLKPGGAIYMFTACQDNGYWVRKAVERGFIYRKQIAMIKSAQVPSIFKNAWRSAFELCMYLTKGTTKTFNFISQSECVNIYNYSIQRKRTAHPTEKPQELIERLIRVSSNPGDLVLDPFMGSCTTAVAAKKHGRTFIGFERNPGYIAMGEERLKELDGQASDGATVA